MRPESALTNLKIFKTLGVSKKFKSYPTVTMHPPRLKSFILYYVGLLLLPKLNYKLRLSNRPVSATRKKLYSFIKPNELRFRAFSARRRLTVIKLMRRLDRFTISPRRISSLQNAQSFFRSRGAGETFSNNALFRLPILTKSNMYYKENFFKFYETTLNQARTLHRDVTVERIKFKPGYQRLWRKFRLALAESLNIRYTYQQQLTKYLIKFSRKISQRSYTIKENNLRNIMLYSRLIPDLATLRLLLRNSVVFLNHKVVRD